MERFRDGQLGSRAQLLMVERLHLGMAKRPGMEEGECEEDGEWENKFNIIFFKKLLMLEIGNKPENAGDTQHITSHLGRETQSKISGQ